MNFKHFKKISEDDKKAVLRHPDGHEVHIAKNALSDSMKSRLESLQADKGSVDQAMDRANAEVRNRRGMPQQYARGGIAEDQAPEGYGKVTVIDDAPMPIGTVIMKARGGKVKGYDEGGEVSENDSDAQAYMPGPLMQQREIYNQLLSSQPLTGAKQQASQSDYMQPGSAPNNVDPELWRKAGIAEQTQERQEAEDKANQPNPQAAEQARMQAMGQQMSQSPQTAQQSPQVAPAQMPQQQAQAGDIQHEPAFDQSKIIQAQQDQVARQQELAQRYQQSYKEIDNESKSFMQDIADQHIDPQHYMKSMGPVGQIGTAIALLAMGANGLGGGAMQYLNDQQNKDIDAQKAELGKKENLLSANFKRMGNTHDAIAMTRVMQNEVLAGKIQTEMMKSQSPLEQAKLQQAYRQVNFQKEMMKQQLANSMAMGSGGGLSEANEKQFMNSSRYMSPEIAKDHEARYIGGVGMASRPVTPEERKQLTMSNSLDRAMNEVKSIAQNGYNSLSLDQRRAADTKIKLAQDLVRRAKGEGVFREGEKKFIEELTGGSPAEFLSKYTSGPKYQAILDNNKLESDELKRSMGLTPFAQSGVPQGQMPLSFKPKK